MNKNNANIRKIAALTSALAISSGMSLTAYARDTIYTREEIIDEYWTQYWDDTAPGEENAEGSLEYHILDMWLNEQYPHTWYENPDIYTVDDWSSYQDIHYAWREYHQKYVENWHFNDEDGVFTIEDYDPETGETGGLLYRFEFVNGKWLMIDTAGNVVDSFDPHGGSLSTDDSSEEDKEPTYNSWSTVINDGCLSISTDGHTYYIYNGDNDKLHKMEKNIYDAYNADDKELFFSLLDEYGATEDRNDSSHYNYDGELPASGEFRTNQVTDNGSRVVSTQRVTGELKYESEVLPESDSTAESGSESEAESDSDSTEPQKSKSLPVIVGIAAGVVAAGVIIVVKKRNK